MSGLGGFDPLPLRLGGSATEGWTAAQHARASADLASCCYTLPFAVVTFHVGGDGSTVVIDSYNSMPGCGAAFAPTITRFTGGYYLIEWEKNWNDAYERPEPIALRHVFATIRASTANKIVATILGDLATVEVRTFDNTGASVDANVTVEVI